MLPKGLASFTLFVEVKFTEGKQSLCLNSKNISTDFSSTNHYIIYYKNQYTPHIMCNGFDPWFYCQSRIKKHACLSHPTHLNTAIYYGLFPYEEVSSHPIAPQCIKINLTPLKGFSAAHRMSSLFCLCQQIRNVPLLFVNKGLCLVFLLATRTIGRSSSLPETYNQCSTQKQIRDSALLVTS